MGEVYRARDTRLDRTVAIKVLPATFAASPDLRERFNREARAISQLSHPHICALHDIGEAPNPDSTSSSASAVHFLVLEYLEGQTLADRLATGALPLEQALTIAVQIADALDTAHRAGIVHRDLKPGNVMLTKSGAGSTGSPRAKLLDFGLAKTGSTMTRAPAMAATSTPTINAPLTAQGSVLGTFQYMAPEVIEGQEADARTDIFAFGCVLYEILTGKRAFAGKTQASLIAAILQSEPSSIAADAAIASPPLDHIVRRCLAKDPDARWQTMRDVREELRWIVGGGGVAESRPVPSAHASRRWMAAAGVSTLLSLAVAPIAVSHLREAAPAAETVRFAIGAPEHASFLPTSEAPHATLSPDGRRLAFVAARPDSPPQLWIRSLDSLEAQPLAGTEGAATSFWSPDGRAIGFFAANKLKTIEVSGGLVQTLCDAELGGSGRGGTWSQDGTILFNPGVNGGLSRVSSNGGSPTPVTTLDASRKETGHRHPFFLPDGRHFVYRANPTNTIWLASLDSKDTELLGAADSRAVYVPPGFLLFVRQTTLVAQPFDAATLKTLGEAVPIAEQVRVSTNNQWGQFSASTTGVVAYRTGASNPPTQLRWVDRAGRPLSSIGQPAPYRNPVSSPDGTRVAVEQTDAQNRTSDIWVIELAHGVASRFTFDPANDIYPVWAPDGSRIAFGSDRQGGLFNIYQKPSNGSGADELILKLDDAESAPYDWSRDGRAIVFRHFTGSTYSLGLLPFSDNRKPQILEQATSGSSRVQGQVSPDGRWVAYASNESGRYEVFVKNIQSAGGKWQISKDGAVSPRWRGDGKELFYYAVDGRLMAVPIAGTSALEVGTATALFTPRLLGGPTVSLGLRQQYDVSRDGQRFLLNTLTEDAAPPITVVLNWPSMLKK